jgi:ATP-grasp ribosomal peptide maturase
MDLGDFPKSLTLRGETCTGGWRGELRTPTECVALSDIQSIYYRRPSGFSFPEDLSDADRVFAGEEARHGLGGLLAAMDVLWVNDPIRASVADYKPLQLKIASRSGLLTPATLVTNDLGAVIDFAAAQSGPIVCKALSPIVHSENGEVRITFTTPVDPAGIDPAELAVTAHLFQAWVPKEYEVRVTMVGRTPFAVTIHASSESGHIDWRSDYGALTYSPGSVPDDVRAGMVRYLDTLGLAYGAFDFVVKPTGEWVFLECNPAGQWLWLEEATGLPMAAALADLLVGGQQV